jgi:hypothetical protein
MFEKKTAIILGAGASKEAGLPVGYVLKEKIASILDISFGSFGDRQESGDTLVYEALCELVRRDDLVSRDVNPHLYMAWRIRDAMPQAISIDNYLDAHQGNVKLERCGKLAIARAILNAERESLLYIDRSNSYNTIDQKNLVNTWYNSFFQLLTENCRVDDLEKRLSSIKLIIFNYDRCLEHFLYHSLQTYYGINETDAAKLVKGIEIYHPYGTVGSLPWYGGEVIADFGIEPNSRQLVDLVSQIRTFTEGMDPDSSDIIAIQESISQSNILLFLGFAYHRLNLDLIRPNTPHHDPMEVSYFGTAIGISKSDCGAISDELSALGGVEKSAISIRNDSTCSKLFTEYWRALSLA